MISYHYKNGRKVITAGRLKFELIRGSGFMAQTICGDFPPGTRNRKQKILKRFAEWGIVTKAGTTDD
jgi:hypothetical protein